MAVSIHWTVLAQNCIKTLFSIKGLVSNQTPNPKGEGESDTQKAIMGYYTVELGDIPVFCSLTICSKYRLVIEPFTASTGLSFLVTHRMRYAIIDFRYEHVVAFSLWWTAGTDRKDECSAECSAGPS